ncbi:MAG: hypothetical protein ACRDI2_05485 [Chloroflexota bacterium]
MIIEPRPCPRCAAPHTARIADGLTVCFNCRASWRTSPNAGLADPPEPLPAPPYPFTPRELARLAAYRAAVAAGFYNEGLPPKGVASTVV